MPDVMAEPSRPGPAEAVARQGTHDGVGHPDLLATFDLLAATIRERAQGKRVIFIPNPGNWGDGLIRYGAKRFLYDYGIEHTELVYEKRGMKSLLIPYLLRAKNYLFIYSGGSAWGYHYHHGYDRIAMISKFTDNIIVLPSSYFFNPTLARAVLFRRDEFESKTFCPQSIFCHDMAIYLIARGLTYDFGPPEVERGNLYRRDKESSRRFEDVADSVDLSALGDHMSNGDDFLREIARYGHIITDRLHVGIGAAILGRPVDLYSGDDFKIGAIYKSSLKGRLPNVRFMDE